RDGAAPPAAKPPLSLRLSITYRPPWRLLFVSFVTGGILLSVWKWSGSDSCACMSIVINRFLNNAGGCPRRDWPRRSRLWNDALPSGAIESVVTCAAAFRRNFNARLLRIFSGRDSSNKSKCFRHPGLAAGRPAFLCPDVPGRPHFGNHISAHRRARSNQRGRQNEQHWSRLGAAPGELRPLTHCRLSVEPPVICCQLYVIGPSHQRARKLVFQTTARYRDIRAVGRFRFDRCAFSLPSRSGAFRACEPALRDG